MNGNSGDSDPSAGEMDELGMRRFAAWVGRQLREQRLSHGQLARAAGLDKSTITRMLLGTRRPSLSTAARVVAALGVPDDHPDPPPYRGVVSARPRVDPASAVERALASDPALTPEGLDAVMSRYHRLRRVRSDPAPGRPSSGAA